MLKVGLTGGIGCGKSTVAERFAALNVPFIDADIIAHNLTAPCSPVLIAIEAVFGKQVRQPDGALNRAWLRQHIFADMRERKKLEAILHPLILENVRKQLHALHDVPYVLLVIPLLLETQTYRDLIDRVLVIDCLEDQQRVRVADRNGMSAADINAILAAQMPRAQRLALADEVLTNTGDWVALQAQVLTLHETYLALSAKKL